MVTNSGRVSARPDPDVHPAVGDWVSIENRYDEWWVDGVVVRERFISRAGDDHVRVIASNLDVVFVCMTAGFNRITRRLDRYVALATDSGAGTFVVLTKVDLAPESVTAARRACEQQFGLPVVGSSAASGRGIDQIAQAIPAGQTAVVIGPSGVGKSSILNALCGGDVHSTARIRESDGRGRHTTTFRGLVELPTGGLLIDTPGLREIQLAIRGDALEHFPDVDELVALCRFRDCQHAAEPGCAVRDALESGALDEQRYARWSLTRSAPAPRREVASKAARRKLVERRDWRRNPM